MKQFFAYIRLLVAVGFAAGFLTACNQSDSVAARVAKSHARYDAPALWKVTDDNSTLYLFGTVHLMQPDIKWQKRDMLAAFDEVGTVFFETPDDDRAALQTGLLQKKYGLYPPGERLTDHLGTINHNRLMAAAYNADVPLSRLESFRPWLAADILTVAGADKAGLRYENSADAHMRTKARQANKNIRALDDIETYFQAVTGHSEEVQMQAFEQTIINFNSLAEDTLSVNAAWLVGNTELLERELLHPVQTRSPELYTALFTDRNAKWVKTLDDFMQGDSSAMVVVGIGHMLGTDGLPVRFEELGYKTERVKRLDLPN